MTILSSTYHHIVEGCAFVPPRQFIRTLGGFWERSWGGLGEGFGGSWGVRGRSWGELGEHFGAILKVWPGFRSQVRLGRLLGRLLADSKGQDDSNLRPKRDPCCSQNGIKIDAKIDRNIDGFGNRFWKGFWSILGGKMEASWNQNGIKT